MRAGRAAFGQVNNEALYNPYQVFVGLPARRPGASSSVTSHCHLIAGRTMGSRRKKTKHVCNGNRSTSHRKSSVLKLGGCLGELQEPSSLQPCPNIRINMPPHHRCSIYEERFGAFRAGEWMVPGANPPPHPRCVFLTMFWHLTRKKLTCTHTNKKCTLMDTHM